MASVVRVGPDAWEWLTAADRSGRVGGHFRSGVNAVFGSEALVSLHSPSVPIHPWALVADLPWEDIEEGDPVVASGSKLSVGQFVLPLAQAEVVDLTFHPPEQLVSFEKLQERAALIERLLAETPDPFESEFDRAFVRDRDRILDTWRETGEPTVLLDLIGRGPGTTPAGDDTLLGLLAGLTVFEAIAPDAAGSRLQATCHTLRAQPHHQTSLLSAQLLTSAAGGRFPSNVLDLQCVLASRETTAAMIVSTATAADTVGRTTGRATLAGLTASPRARLPGAAEQPPSRSLRLALGCRRALRQLTGVSQVMPCRGP